MMTKLLPGKRGLTLIEVLVALFILAIMATMVMVAVKQLILTEKRVKAKLFTLNQLEMAEARLRLDLSQAIDRPVLLAGGSPTPAFSGDNQAFTFVRTGNFNPGGKALASHLEGLSYQGGSRLTRVVSAGLDDEKSPSASLILLPTIEDWHVSYIDEKGQPHTHWPLPQTVDASTHQSNPPDPLPTAVQIDFSLAGWGPLSYYILLTTSNLHTETATDKGATSGVE